MLKTNLFTFYIILCLTINSNANELKITSNNLEIDRNKQISIFSENVHAINQDIKIWSDKLILTFNDDNKEIEKVSAEGNVKIIREEITATSESGLYYPKSEKLNLFGDVKVLENNNYVRCD